MSYYNPVIFWSDFFLFFQHSLSKTHHASFTTTIQTQSHHQLQYRFPEQEEETTVNRFIQWQFQFQWQYPTKKEEEVCQKREDFQSSPFGFYQLLTRLWSASLRIFVSLLAFEFLHFSCLSCPTIIQLLLQSSYYYNPVIRQFQNLCPTIIQWIIVGHSL